MDEQLHDLLILEVGTVSFHLIVHPTDQKMFNIARASSEMFSPVGALATLAGYEYRPQQEAMARAIADALLTRKHLIIEAPTGVGKTLAYLVPAIFYALECDHKAIISTHTKNLQEQLFKKDIPLVHSILGKDFRVAVLKGRQNYLCTTRLRNTLASTGLLFEKTEMEQLRRIRDWSAITIDGDMENLGFIPDARIWDMVCSERDVCSSSLCTSDCFFQRAKERTRSADVIILNHALFFTLLATHEAEDHFLFHNDFVIFDEAHTLESVAGASLGAKVSRYQALAAVHKLYNSKTKKGLLAKESKALKFLCGEAERCIVEFFDRVKDAALRVGQTELKNQGGPFREVRIRKPHLLANTVHNTLNDLEKNVHTIEQSFTEPRAQECTVARRALLDVDKSISQFLQQSEPDFTYWIELGGVRGESVALCASPIEIADRIGPRLFRDGTSVIMTSATLTVGGSLDYFKGRVGALDVEGLVLDSPFDHMNQMRLALARGIPEPDKNGFSDQLPARIMQSIERSHGKALVLFTSNALMQATAKAVAPSLADKGVTLLVQGGNTQRHELLEEFKKDVHSVLFGLDSFWMGVDVPGEALEHVIITRLPFTVPNHPLTEARLELIERRGGNPFTDFSLPEAILKFRQGVGRLLRSRTDKGMVTILDSRIITKRYGQMFLSSISRCPVEIISADGETEYLDHETW